MTPAHSDPDVTNCQPAPRLRVRILTPDHDLMLTPRKGAENGGWPAASWVYLESGAPQGDLWAEDEDMPDGTYARSGDASFTPEAVQS